MEFKNIFIICKLSYILNRQILILSFFVEMGLSEKMDSKSRYFDQSLSCQEKQIISKLYIVDSKQNYMHIE